MEEGRTKSYHDSRSFYGRFRRLTCSLSCFVYREAEVRGLWTAPADKVHGTIRCTSYELSGFPSGAERIVPLRREKLTLSPTLSEVAYHRILTSSFKQSPTLGQTATVRYLDQSRDGRHSPSICLKSSALQSGASRLSPHELPAIVKPRNP
ncbi:hypothetical protein BDM02DRAFT_1348420 [Thelephora ganbajun]|uniref:Uncharacterized protein n=1 Tax=Thelephora ganbajun TaxID=370292 RepID=A0ACB6ZNB1_THEGA|nr:hypothetical protein BDM02DRAFT_1348420 [Thelephora ganbajun]